MRREVKGTFTFQCGHHGVALDDEPMLLPLYGDAGVTLPDHRNQQRNGQYAIDTSEMFCPKGIAEQEEAKANGIKDPSPEMDAIEERCTNSWHVWLDPDA